MWLNNSFKGEKMEERTGKYSDLFDLQTAADYLRISKGTLCKYTSSKKIRHYKLGRKVFFKVEDLDSFIESKMVAISHRFTKSPKPFVTKKPFPVMPDPFMMKFQIAGF
jgi:excisionase family DNA binding protein